MNIMYNEDKFTRLTLEQSDKKIVWEVPYEDIDGTDDMMQAIYTLMIGMTFVPETVFAAMANFINEHSKEFEVIEKDNSSEETEEE